MAAGFMGYTVWGLTILVLIVFEEKRKEREKLGHEEEEDEWRS